MVYLAPIFIGFFHFFCQWNTHAQSELSFSIKCCLLLFNHPVVVVVIWKSIEIESFPKSYSFILFSIFVLVGISKRNLLHCTVQCLSECWSPLKNFFLFWAHLANPKRVFGRCWLIFYQKRKKIEMDAILDSTNMCWVSLSPLMSCRNSNELSNED